MPTAASYRVVLTAVPCQSREPSAKLAEHVESAIPKQQRPGLAGDEVLDVEAHLKSRSLERSGSHGHVTSHTMSYGSFRE